MASFGLVALSLVAQCIHAVVLRDLPGVSDSSAKQAITEPSAKSFAPTTCELQPIVLAAACSLGSDKEAFTDAIAEKLEQVGREFFLIPHGDVKVGELVIGSLETSAENDAKDKAICKLMKAMWSSLACGAVVFVDAPVVPAEVFDVVNLKGARFLEFADTQRAEGECRSYIDGHIDIRDVGNLRGAPLADKVLELIGEQNANPAVSPSREGVNKYWYVPVYKKIFDKIYAIAAPEIGRAGKNFAKTPQPHVTLLSTGECDDDSAQRKLKDDGDNPATLCEIRSLLGRSYGDVVEFRVESFVWTSKIFMAKLELLVDPTRAIDSMKKFLHITLARVNYSSAGTTGGKKKPCSEKKNRTQKQISKFIKNTPGEYKVRPLATEEQITFSGPIYSKKD